MGVRVVCGSGIRIAGNDISAAGLGIGTGGPFAGAVTGLRIERNTIHDAATGVLFDGVTQSTVSNNTVTNNSQQGIALQEASGCRGSVPGWECFYSTGNVVAGNQMRGNGTDLYHDEVSTPNTWQDNTCQSSQGADIPPCQP